MKGVKPGSRGGIGYVTYDAFERYEGIRVLTTVRMPIIDELKSNDSGLALQSLGPGLASILDIPFARFIAANQVHSSRVFSVKAPFIDQIGSPEYFIVPSADALFTDLSDVPLIVFTADCLPVFLYDASRKVVGLVHAGRKGIEAGMIPSAVHELVQSYGVDPSDVTALIGASIGPCCYPVDLWSQSMRQLKEHGIKQVHNPRICTGCNTGTFYSYRVEKGTNGRMLSVIMLE
jgi:copper oxidase (laccase) domain-containing protein